MGRPGTPFEDAPVRGRLDGKQFERSFTLAGEAELRIPVQLPE